MPKRSAALVGYTEWAPQRNWPRPMFGTEAAAELAASTLMDAGIEKDEVDGLVIGGLQESPLFAPLAMAEYLGIHSHFNEVVDIGGATSAAMVVRAAMAIEVGLAKTVLILAPSVPPPPEEGGAAAKMMLPFYLMGDSWGSPQSQYDIPYGLVAATPSFAMVASRYMAEYGVAPETLAKVVVDQRYNAQYAVREYHVNVLRVQPAHGCVRQHWRTGRLGLCGDGRPGHCHCSRTHHPRPLGRCPDRVRSDEAA